MTVSKDSTRHCITASRAFLSTTHQAMRSDGRQDDTLRPLQVRLGELSRADGSGRFSFGTYPPYLTHHPPSSSYIPGPLAFLSLLSFRTAREGCIVSALS